MKIAKEPWVYELLDSSFKNFTDGASSFRTKMPFRSTLSTSQLPLDELDIQLILGDTNHLTKNSFGDALELIKNFEVISYFGSSGVPTQGVLPVKNNLELNILNSTSKNSIANIKLVAVLESSRREAVNQGENTNDSLAPRVMELKSMGSPMAMVLASGDEFNTIKTFVEKNISSVENSKP